MDDRISICPVCGKLLKQVGTDQTGKYKKCGTCKNIKTDGKET